MHFTRTFPLSLSDHISPSYATAQNERHFKSLRYIDYDELLLDCEFKFCSQIILGRTADVNRISKDFWSKKKKKKGKSQNETNVEKSTKTITIRAIKFEERKKRNCH